MARKHMLSDQAKSIVTFILLSGRCEVQKRDSNLGPLEVGGAWS
jgi:hypothetical protein